jgi:uncharacterized protein YecE (DUF72 family)
MARILIGTSGWHYASWRGPFFPTSLPLKQQLAYYASQFSTTELNGVFYRTPTIKAVKAWRDQTGENFTFAWKASQFITHWKRLSSKSDTSLEWRISRNGPTRFPLIGPTLNGLPAEPQATSFTRPFSAKQVSSL